MKAGIVDPMQVVDGLAMGLLLAGAGAFALGAHALASSSDLAALFWSLLGLVSLGAATRLGR